MIEWPGIERNVFVYLDETVTAGAGRQRCGRENRQAA
jgi:hypothetical protein